MRKVIDNDTPITMTNCDGEWQGITPNKASNGHSVK